jgi:hypothetical protein
MRGSTKRYRHLQRVVRVKGGREMTVVAFALPILPGQEEHVRSMGEVFSSSGELREGYEESRKRLGIREEKIWVQRTPIGASIIVYWETDDPQRTLREIADSQDEVDQKFRQVIEDAAPAIDLSQEKPLSNELLIEWQQPQ